MLTCHQMLLEDFSEEQLEAVSLEKSIGWVVWAWFWFWFWVGFVFGLGLGLMIAQKTDGTGLRQQTGTCCRVERRWNILENRVF